MTSKYKAWSKAVLIPISELVFTDWNCNEMDNEKLAELASDLENVEDPQNPRFDEPVQVVGIADNRWLVVGGEHRVKALSAIGQTSAPCVIREDLENKSREELMLWSVRRNNLRGKINSQKYAELEAEIINNGNLQIEAARKAMLIDRDLGTALAGSVSEFSENAYIDNAATDNNKNSDDDGHKEINERKRDKASMIAALKMVEQNALLDSADTVELGYMFFAQGKNGQIHLVIDMKKPLLENVKKMVELCKNNNDRVEDFLNDAINAEIPNWE